MKRIWILLAIAALVLTACGPEPEPTMSPADVQGTAMAAALTMVAETQAAIPTATPLPPTEASTATPFPTNTVAPLSLASPTGAISALPATLPTNTSVPSVGGNDSCNQILTSWDGESAKITVKNATKPQGTIVLSIWVNTTMGQCGYIPANPNSFYIPMGTFSAGAFVNGKKDFKVFGGGVINRTGNYTLWVTNDTISLKAGCAPNC
jgi:hypothetical protein